MSQAEHSRDVALDWLWTILVVGVLGTLVLKFIVDVIKL